MGGTPCARPEDFELNPRNPAEILLAMTDGAPGSDGYPDSRIFQVAKHSTALNEGQAVRVPIHKLIEDAWDGSGDDLPVAAARPRAVRRAPRMGRGSRTWTT